MKFSASLAGSSKVNNHPAARKAKRDIRQRVFDQLKDSGPIHVFDAFAGDGVMYRSVWNKAAFYMGCDRNWYRDERLCFVADNRRVLRTIELAHFNVFDLDAWGNPWEQAYIIAERRRLKAGERLGLVITDGTSLALKMNSIPIALRILAGISRELAGSSRISSVICDRAIKGLCAKMRCKVIKQWRAQGRSGAAVRYIGLVLEGNK